MDVNNRDELDVELIEINNNSYFERSVFQPVNLTWWARFKWDLYSRFPCLLYWI
jgi:hypothetical protein